jgi:hypothetical protein
MHKACLLAAVLAFAPLGALAQLSLDDDPWRRWQERSARESEQRLRDRDRDHAENMRWIDELVRDFDRRRHERRREEEHQRQLRDLDDRIRQLEQRR